MLPAGPAHAVLTWIGLPTSLQSAVLGAVLLAACNELLAQSAQVLLPSMVQQGQAISRSQSKADDGDAPKRGVM